MNEDADEAVDAGEASDEGAADSEEDQDETDLGSLKLSEMTKE